MSDYSTQTMEPRKRRTCGNCNNWHSVGVIRGYCGLDETLENGCLPLHLNDDAACGDYEDIPPTLQERYEHLAQVAREMFWCVRDPLDFAERTGEKYTRDGHYYFTEIFAEQLEALGVSVDD